MTSPESQPEITEIERRSKTQEAEHVSHRNEYVATHYFIDHPTDKIVDWVKQKKIEPEESWEGLREMKRDERTGVQRPDLLEYELDYEASLDREKIQPVSVAIFDIDHFKQINTEMNHVQANEVLKRVAETLTLGVRQSGDLLSHHKSQDGSVTRWGGEEFAVILPGADLEQAQRVAERLRARIENDLQDIRPGGQSITVSGGVAQYDKDLHGFDDTPERKHIKAWLEDADKQVFAAKEAGRNKVFPQLEDEAA